jgi:hypothetical protein
MSLFDEIVQAGDGPDEVQGPRGKHPAGWEPGLVMNGNVGTLTTEPMAVKPNWDKLLEVWDLDPAQYQVLEPVQYRAWDANLGDGNVQRMYYYKASVITRRVGGLDYDQLVDEVKNWKVGKGPKVTTGPLSFVWLIADLQVGKSDGDGTAGTVARYLQGIADIKARVKELRRAGREIGTLYICGAGDCIENVKGHYAQQLFRADLNLTQQVRVMRRLIVRAVKELAPLFDKVVIACVPGNHGEATRSEGGKSDTDFSDNWDVEVFSAAYDVLQENSAFSHVSFVAPQGQELTLTLDISGTITTIAHGHQFPSPSGRESGATKWWAKQAHGLQQAGESTLLLAGHLHHLFIERNGPKTFIQAPALDGGSDWFRAMTGAAAPPGILTLVVGQGGWRDLCIL